MPRVPENINFCIFAECHYLQGEECTIEKCVFNPKLIRWWEWNLVKDSSIKSLPPESMKAVKNIYFDPSMGDVKVVYDNTP